VELPEDCTRCNQFREAYKVNAVKIASDPTRFVLQFETDGSMAAKDVLTKALDILAERFSDLATQADNLV